MASTASRSGLRRTRTRPATADVLVLDRVSKSYRQGDECVVALDAVSLRVAAGEFVAVVGASGSGKSTLLHVAAGLDSADSGHVRLDGVDVSNATAAETARLRRRAVGFVFQAFHLIPSLTAVENVAMPLWLDRGRDGYRRASAALADVGLAARQHAHPPDLSGGQMQRVAIARAIAGRPKIVFADEPTGSLDSETSAEILDVLTTRVAELDMALVLVTHDEAAAGRADRVLTMVDGRLS